MNQVHFNRRLTITALALLAVPASFLLFLGAAEMVGGEVSGAQHLVEAGAIVVLMLAAWRYPRVAGMVLLAIGATFFVGWLVLMLARGELGDLGLFGWLTVGLGIFLPPIVAGLLLLRAVRNA